MRPLGEISTAILGAAEKLARVEDVGGEMVRHGGTLRELAQHACVGVAAATHSVINLRRAGKLEAVNERRVSNRNRPVVEYAPAQPKEPEAFFDVASVFSNWARG
jgi:hypothetical protein